MKKKSGLKRALPIIPIEALETMNTRALIARLKRLRFCKDSSVVSDLTEEEISTVSDKILFKSDLAWKRAYKELKSVLDSREHIPN